MKDEQKNSTMEERRATLKASVANKQSSSGFHPTGGLQGRFRQSEIRHSFVRSSVVRRNCRTHLHIWEAPGVSDTDLSALASLLDQQVLLRPDVC